MQKVTTTALLFFICLHLSAQYKKASFFGKEGRTYGLNAQAYTMGDGKGNPFGFTATFGRDRDGKQFFSSWELQVIPSYKFSFNTTDEYNEPITVSGKTRTHLIYGVHYGYFLLKNNEEEKQRRIKPYLFAGFNIVLLGGASGDIENNNIGYNKKAVADQNFSMGLRGGIGCLVGLSPKFALKLDGGYNRQFNISSEAFEDTEEYHLYHHHPFASVGIRFRVATEE